MGDTPDNFFGADGCKVPEQLHRQEATDIYPRIPAEPSRLLDDPVRSISSSESDDDASAATRSNIASRSSYDLILGFGRVGLPDAEVSGTANLPCGGSMSAAVPFGFRGGAAGRA